MAPVRDLANTIECTYRNKDRAEESAELPPYSISGAVAADGGIPSVQRVDLSQFVLSPTQAARVQKIAAYQARAQRRITGLPASAIIARPGEFVTMGGVTRMALHEARSNTSGVAVKALEDEIDRLRRDRDR